MFRILSCEGGGIRGLMIAVILTKLEEVTGRHTSELFDLIIGSSTGALVATVLTCPDGDGAPKYTAKNLIDVYTKEGPIVFEPSMWLRMTTFGGVWGPRYYTKNRDEKFQAWLNDATIKNTVKDIIIPTYDRLKREPVFFKTRKARLDEADNHKLVDVVKASTAAPTVWPQHRYNDSLYMDPLSAKNPLMFAIVEAHKQYHIGLDEMVVLNIGTGYPIVGSDNTKIPESGPPFLYDILDGTVNANTHHTNYMAEAFLKKPSRLFNIDFPLPEKHMGITDVSKDNIDFLITYAMNWANDHVDEIREIATLLTEGLQVHLNTASHEAEPTVETTPKPIAEPST